MVGNRNECNCVVIEKEVLVRPNGLTYGAIWVMGVYGNGNCEVGVMVVGGGSCGVVLYIDSDGSNGDSNGIVGVVMMILPPGDCCCCGGGCCNNPAFFPSPSESVNS